MKIKFYLGLAVLLAALTFSIQNSSAVDVKFLAWKFTTSLALILFGLLAAGLLGGWAVSSALRFTSGSKNK